MSACSFACASLSGCIRCLLLATCLMPDAVRMLVYQFAQQSASSNNGAMPAKFAVQTLAQQKAVALASLAFASPPAIAVCNCFAVGKLAAAL